MPPLYVQKNAYVRQKTWDGTPNLETPLPKRYLPPKLSATAIAVVSLASLEAVRGGSQMPLLVDRNQSVFG